MGMHIDKTGQGGFPGTVDDFGIRALCGQDNCSGRTDSGDEAPVDQHIADLAVNGDVF